MLKIFTNPGENRKSEVFPFVKEILISLRKNFKLTIKNLISLIFKQLNFFSLSFFNISLNIFNVDITIDKRLQACIPHVGISAYPLNFAHQLWLLVHVHKTRKIHVLQFVCS